MRSAIVCVAAVAVAATVDCQAATLNVPAEYGTIQAAITVAVDGDTVLVQPGTYAGTANTALDFSGKGIGLVAASGPSVTIIDCQGLARGFYFHSAEDSMSFVSGFTVRNGAAVRGGGMCCLGASPTISGCVLDQNTAREAGGGFYCESASPRIASCRFVANTVQNSGYGFGGGGMQCNASSPIIVDCVFNENNATSGGGLYCIFGAHPSVARCVFKDNVAFAYHGGGIFCYSQGTPDLVQCDFVENTAARNGGGLYCENSSPSVSACVFDRNAANGTITGHGGGAVCLVGSSPRISDCSFVSNHSEQGGGVNCRSGSAPVLEDVTFTGNTATAGGGLYCREDSSPRLNGALFESGSALSGGGLYADSAAPSMTDCRFVRNHATGTDPTHGGGGVHLYMSGGTLTSCAFIGNVGIRGGALHLRQSPEVSLSSVTLAENEGVEGSSIYCRASHAAVGHGILAFGTGAAVACVSTGGLDLTCCDVYGNSGGDWTGCIAGQSGIGGNISLDPLFCGGGDIDEAYALREDSPCIAAGGCGQIGKWGVGCAGSAVEARSWGAIKARYRN
jgi:predicted outer membrane repeat protein